MTSPGEIERLTQNRIIKLFREKLQYTYLGNLEDDPTNSTIEEINLLEYLTNKAGYPEALAKRAIYLLKAEANRSDRNLYNNNKEVYKLLRYGVEVTAGPG